MVHVLLSLVTVIERQAITKSSWSHLQELSEGEHDDGADELETGPFEHHTDNSNDENDIDEETM